MFTGIIHNCAIALDRVAGLKTGDGLQALRLHAVLEQAGWIKCGNEEKLPCGD